MKEQPAQRRQAFLNPKFSIAYDAHLQNSALFWSQHRPEADSASEAASLAAASIASDTFERLVLHYTAGQAIEPMREELSGVVAAHVQYQKALAAHEQAPQIAPLGLERLAEYERCMQLIALCYLLHRRDLLPSIANLEDPGYAGEDALYEELLDYELPDRFETDTLYHGEPFSLLVQTMFRKSDEESIADLKAYCKAWYPAMKAAPWHDSHLRMTDTDGDYFGYWAFEAGAVAYLLDLDDSSIDHMVYPKDLVDWARANKQLLEQAQGNVWTSLRCEGGEPCPREGYWFTPAHLDSRRRFEAGEMMSKIAGDYGATIWQWDEKQ